MQGWLVAEPSRGTVVAYDLPRVRPHADKGLTGVTTEQLDELSDVLHISDGTPDARIMPAVELARAIRHAGFPVVVSAARRLGRIRRGVCPAQCTCPISGS